MFNALFSLDLIRDAAVLDLYAGSGALGIEALSRGAAHVTFVERDRAALRALRANIDHLGIGDRTTVLAGDARAMAPAVPADVVLADPPYGFDAWPELLGAVRTDFVVAEAQQEVPAPAGWATVRAKRYGRTWVTFLERASE